MDASVPVVQDQAMSSLDEQQIFITKVFGWMSLALVVSGLTALVVVESASVVKLIFGNILIFYVLLGLELLEVIFLSAAVKNISAALATTVFLLYAFTTGLTLSVVFLVYSASSIASTFLVTSLTFGAMALYGYTTRRDLTSIGSFLTMALFGLVIASIVNLFWANSTLYWITTYAGSIIFIGLTAYDTQKIKNLNVSGETSDEERKEAIIGALTLYLDFINLFLDLLRILGRRK